MQANPLTIRENLAHLIITKKGINANRLENLSNFNKLGFDNLDLVDLILEVEKAYNVIIPDEIPLNSVDDFVDFICGRTLQQAS